MTAAKPLKYKRLLLKLSGEALMGKGSYGFDMGVDA
jgi:uridylate kinase